MQRARYILAGALLALAAAFFLLDLGQFLSLDYLRAQRETITALVEAHLYAMAAGYFVAYVLVTALSLPGAAVMTLAGGALFGLWTALILVSFAATLGATAAFLVARFVLRDTVKKRFGQRLATVDRGVERDGAYYLFALRLVPIFPFFVINLVMGLTALRTWTFFWVSQVGMLPGTLVYVNAGTQLGQIDSLTGILSPSVLGAFAVLGFFPLVTRWILDWLERRRVYRSWQRPRRYDRNVIVIGAGSAGLVCAYIAATLKARVTLIEQSKMGGDCLNTGCVPSKALLRSARLVHEAQRAPELGIRQAAVTFDFADVMARTQRVIARIAPHDSPDRYRALGVEVVQGRATITSPWSVRVEGRDLTARKLIVATGAQPLVPPIPGLPQAPYVTSDTLWDMDRLPPRLVVMGGGPIGCEMAQAFARLGSQVTLVEMGERLLPAEDPWVAERLAQAFSAEGITLRLGHKAVAVKREGDGWQLLCEHAEDTARFAFDRLLVAVGRRPCTEGFGLETLGIGIDARGAIEVDETLRTRYPNIFACGDVAGPYQFTHAASHQAWHATVNALFGGIRRFRIDYAALPWVVFTDPEIAHVGHNETSALSAGIDFEAVTYDMAELDRAIVEEAADGRITLLVAPRSGRILGATIMGLQAGEMITPLTLSIRHGLKLSKLLSTIHPYPTLTEANRFAAGRWRERHAPQRLLAMLGRWHAWRLDAGRTGAERL